MAIIIAALIRLVVVVHVLALNLTKINFNWANQIYFTRSWGDSSPSELPIRFKSRFRAIFFGLKSVYICFNGDKRFINECGEERFGLTPLDDC